MVAFLFDIQCFTYFLLVIFAPVNKDQGKGVHTGTHFINSKNK